MNIRKMKERVYDITQLEETPEYLSLISYFFLNTLEYLKGFMPLKEYRKVFEELVRICLKINRVIKSLRSWTLCWRLRFTISRL